MSWKEGTTIGEAREVLSDFLRDTGCFKICAQCPLYSGGQGCCPGCEKLTPEGCSQRNLSCLCCTCSTLDRHLIEMERFEAWNDLIYGIPREGYRGSHLRPDEERFEISDPLARVRGRIEGYSPTSVAAEYRPVDEEE